MSAILPEMDDYSKACESCLNFPSSDENPLLMTWLRKTQQGETGLIAKTDEEGNSYFWRKKEGMKLIFHSEAGKEETHWKICLTDEAIVQFVGFICYLITQEGISSYRG